MALCPINRLKLQNIDDQESKQKFISELEKRALKTGETIQAFQNLNKGSLGLMYLNLPYLNLPQI